MTHIKNLTSDENPIQKITFFPKTIHEKKGLYKIQGLDNHRITYTPPYQTSFNENQWMENEEIDLSWLSLLLDLSKKRELSFVSQTPYPTHEILKKYNSPTEEDILKSIAINTTITNNLEKDNTKTPKEITLIGSSTGGYGVLAYSSFFPGIINDWGNYSDNKTQIKNVIAIAPWINLDYGIIKHIIDLKKLGISEQDSNEEQLKQLYDYSFNTDSNTLPFLFSNGKETQTINLPKMTYHEMRRKNLMNLIQYNSKPTLIFAHTQEDRIYPQAYKEIAQKNSGETYLSWIDTNNMFQGKQTRNQVLEQIIEFIETGKCSGREVEYFPKKEIPKKTRDFSEQQQKAQEIQARIKHSFKKVYLKNNSKD
jgi:hypothetical protein